MSRRLITTDIFIEDAIKVHGDTYIYDKVEYVNSNTNVIITCKKHGYFNQLPHNHKNGKGCPKCRSDKLSERNRTRLDSPTGTAESFIEKSRKVHSDKYTYEKVVYVESKTKVLITCPKHGDFLQEPRHHAVGVGCTLCGKEKLSKLYALTPEEFIAESSKVHASKYSYDKLEYTNLNKKIIVTCPIHGDFSQNANSHIRGCGCPSCGESGFNPDVPAFIYVLSIEGPVGSFTGYGITGSMERRLREHKQKLKAFGYEISEVYSAPIEGSLARSLENKILNNFESTPQEVVGFKREATKSSFISVKDFVEKCLKECIACE